jgi:hypothetical protein
LGDAWDKPVGTYEVGFLVVLLKKLSERINEQMRPGSGSGSAPDAQLAASDPDENAAMRAKVEQARRGGREGAVNLRFLADVRNLGIGLVCLVLLRIVLALLFLLF